MNSSIGDYLWSSGHRHSVFIKSIDRQIGVATWNNAIPYIVPQTRENFKARYGYYDEGLIGAGNDPRQVGLDRNLLSTGDTVGERGLATRSMLELAARHPSNPFLLNNNASYVVTIQDIQDTQKVQDLSNQRQSIFDGFLSTTLARVNGQVVPPVIPPVLPPVGHPSPPTVPAPSLPPVTPPVGPVRPSPGDLEVWAWLGTLTLQQAAGMAFRKAKALMAAILGAA